MTQLLLYWRGTWGRPKGKATKSSSKHWTFSEKWKSREVNHIAKLNRVYLSSYLPDLLLEELGTFLCGNQSFIKTQCFFWPFPCFFFIDFIKNFLNPIKRKMNLCIKLSCYSNFLSSFLTACISLLPTDLRVAAKLIFLNESPHRQGWFPTDPWIEYTSLSCHSRFSTVWSIRCLSVFIS